MAIYLFVSLCLSVPLIFLRGKMIRQFQSEAQHLGLAQNTSAGVR
jgi:hypothetical protein